MAIMDLFTSLQTIVNERSAKKVRQSIHDGIFRANQVVDANKNLVDQVSIRQDAVEQYNNQMIAEMTDKDVISAPELIQMRDGEPTANHRLDRDFGLVGEKLNRAILSVSHISINPKDFGAVGDGLTDDTNAINDAIMHLETIGGSTLIIPSGEYLINASGIIACDNLTIIMHKDTVLRQIPNNKPNYRTIDLMGKKNVRIYGGELVGERYDHYLDDPSNPWVQWAPNTPMSVGDIVYSYHTGYRVTASGVTGASRPTSGGAVGTSVTNGTVTLSVVSTSVGEWGFGIYANNSENITLHNISIRDYWGDGVYIGDRHHDGFMVKNVSISGMKSDNNRRQGMSVTAVDGLYIRDSEFSNTNGTLPEAGIDFEPNIDANRINNVYLENVRLINNGNNSLVIDFRAITSEYDMNFVGREITCEGPSTIINLPTPTMSGFIKLINYTHRKMTANAFLITKADNGLDLIIDHPTISSGAEYTYQYDDYGSCFVLARSGSSVIGGISIIRPRMNIAGSPTVKPKNILSIISSTDFTTKVNNLSIINPLDVSGVSRPIIRTTNRLEYLNNFVFSDDLEICVLHLTRHETYPNYYAPNIYNTTRSGVVLDLSKMTTTLLTTKVHNFGTNSIQVDVNPNFPLLAGGNRLTIAANEVVELKIKQGNTYLIRRTYS